MYAYRLTFTAKPFTTHDVFEFCQHVLSSHPYPRTTRVYRNVVGNNLHVVVEFECESLAEWEKIHPKWLTGWSEDVRTEWRSLEVEGLSEFWEVAE